MTSAPMSLDPPRNYPQPRTIDGKGETKNDAKTPLACLRGPILPATLLCADQRATYKIASDIAEQVFATYATLTHGNPHLPKLSFNATIAASIWTHLLTSREEYLQTETKKSALDLTKGAPLCKYSNIPPLETLTFHLPIASAIDVIIPDQKIPPRGSMKECKTAIRIALSAQNIAQPNVFPVSTLWSLPHLSRDDFHIPMQDEFNTLIGHYNSPYICKAFDIGFFFDDKAKERCVLVLEYVPMNLLTHVNAYFNQYGTSHSHPLFSTILTQLLDGVQKIHLGVKEKGFQWPPMCHGDLKPDNILISPFSKTCKIAIIDFRTAGNLPTYEYWGPEHWETFSPFDVTVADDYWSIGCIAHYMLFGHIPKWSRLVRIKTMLLSLYANVLHHYKQESADATASKMPAFTTSSPSEQKVESKQTLKTAPLQKTPTASDQKEDDAQFAKLTEILHRLSSEVSPEFLAKIPDRNEHKQLNKLTGCFTVIIKELDALTKYYNSDEPRQVAPKTPDILEKLLSLSISKLKETRELLLATMEQDFSKKDFKLHLVLKMLHPDPKKRATIEEIQKLLAKAPISKR